jgi:NAD(P)-dependent dehydrogenase (short-subunit alcohol dehydrogenase family)
VSWRGGDVTVAVGRVGLPEDVAKPIAFLDPRSSVRRWRTGAARRAVSAAFIAPNGGESRDAQDLP